MEHNRIDEAMAASMRALDARETLPLDASLDERLDASIEVIRTAQRFLQALACDPTPGEEDVGRELRQGAIRDLLGLREQMCEGLPDALNVTTDLVLTAPENLARGITEADREWARAVLLGNGFLTQGELTTFPRDSLHAIVRQRLAQWEVTGDPRG